MKKVYRLTSVILLVALLSIFMCVPASASFLDGTAQYYYSRSDDKSHPVFENISYSNAGDVAYSSTSTNRLKLFESSSSSKDYYYSLSRVGVPLDNVSGTIVISVSYFLYGVEAGSSGWDIAPVTMWKDSNGSVQYGSGEGYTFDVDNTNLSESMRTTGISVSGTFTGTELDPISNLYLSWEPTVAYTHAQYSNGYPYVYVYFRSFRVVSMDASGVELAQLQDIAKGIAQSNEILSAMYGDVLAVCNSIFSRCGDMLEAQQLTNTYFESIIPVLNSISTNTANIYNLLSQQFSLLISTIESESDDIQSTIDNAVDTLIAYFDNVFSSSVNPALPGQSEDITSQGNTFGDAESGYQSTATERFESISADFAGFDGSVLSGVALGSTLFQRVWNVLGDYVIIYTFPLTLSICLVIVGRVSRQHSRSKSGGKSSKPKDSGGDAG